MLMLHSRAVGNVRIATQPNEKAAQQVTKYHQYNITSIDFSANITKHHSEEILVRFNP